LNLLRVRQVAAICTSLLLISTASAQEQLGGKVDLDALTQIKREAFQHSQVMA
jgi:carboxypeptidase Q